MRKLVLVKCMVLAIILACAFSACAGELKPMNIFINQQMIDIDVPVVYENYMPYVPLRYICEALNISVSYDPSVKAIFVDGKMLEQPFMYYGRDVYLTLERVEEVLGLEVGLDGEYEMIAIYSPGYAYKEGTPYWNQKVEREAPAVEPVPPGGGVLPGGPPPEVPPPLFP
ncbi:MAG: hypothetical protein ABRQ39_17405 [Candidatus Eremiobacterota bacterium]